jgi:hypothetical protein
LTRTYWLDLFTATTWNEFLQAGGGTAGFRESSWSTVQKIRPGDYLLCYLVVVQRFVGVLEVVSEPFQDDTRIWQDDTFPCRLRVKALITLQPETGVPIQTLRGSLSIFTKHADPRSWGIYVRRSPTKWSVTDGEAVLDALRQAETHPTSRPVKKAQLAWRPKLLRASELGLVTVPDTAPDSQDAEPPPPVASAVPDVPQPSLASPRSAAMEPALHALTIEGSVVEATQHTEIQWLLLKLGSDMGLDVWVARNDRSRMIDGHRLADVPRIKDTLPLQFDEATTRTIQLIDVLWLRGNAIVAAFEVESTTSIYSGLLRMSDLLAMQPNLNIPLYLVAPDERRRKVLEEVNRPTFSRLSPPMNRMCRYIAFSALRERMGQLGSMVRYLKPEFVEQELSEPCTLVER